MGARCTQRINNFCMQADVYCERLQSKVVFNIVHKNHTSESHFLLS